MDKISGDELFNRLSPETRKAIEEMSWEDAKKMYEKMDKEGWKRVRFLKKLMKKQDNCKD